MIRMNEVEMFSEISFYKILVSQNPVTKIWESARNKDESGISLYVSCA